MTNVNLQAMIHLSVTYKGKSVTAVRDTYDFPNLIDRMETDIPKWMDSNIKYGWGTIQFGDDVFYYFEEADEAMLFKITWCE